MVTYTKAFADVDYRPAGSNNGKQYLDIYHPTTGTAPYPIFAFFEIGGFTNSNRPASVDSDDFLVGDLLNNGWAVAYCELSVAANPPGTTTAVGGGMFRHPTIDSEFDPDGAGDDICLLDATWIIQHLRYNAATYSINPNVIVSGGRSAGAACSAWAGLGVDYIDAGSGIPQRTVSSRANGCYIYQLGTHWMHALTQTVAGGYPTTWKFLRKSSDTTVPCLDLNLAISAHKSALSSASLILPSAAQFSENSTTPVYSAVTPSEVQATGGAIDWGLAANYTPTMLGTATTGLNSVHHPWHGAMMMKTLRALSPFHQSHSRLGILGTSWDYAAEVPEDALLGGLYEFDDTMAWLVSEFQSLGGVDTLNMRVDWAGETSAITMGVNTEWRNGMVQVRKTNTAASQFTGIAATRTWMVSWRSATKGERDQIYSVWKNSKGGALPINFYPPDNTAVLARFLPGSFREVQNGPRMFSISAVLEEVL